MMNKIYAIKLSEINYLSVNDGYIAFESNSENEYEIIVSNGKSYLASESILYVDEETSNFICKIIAHIPSQKKAKDSLAEQLVMLLVAFVLDF